MAVTWSEIQHRRLMELDAGDTELARCFDTHADRDATFQRLEKTAVKAQRGRLLAYREAPRRPRLNRLEDRLVEALVKNGFSQVATPIIMSKGHLAKMSITSDHPLAKQVYWLEKNKCLRPMLAPHLYFVLKDLLRLWPHPVRIFEVGPCFRIESQGALHSNEFTMLNMVEMGCVADQCRERLAEMAEMVMQAAGISDYVLDSEHSEVYGDTVDVLVGEKRVEVGSAAMGPHRLDRAWKIDVPWVGIGFGLERLLLMAAGGRSLAKMGRSLSYLDGIRLNI